MAYTGRATMPTIGGFAGLMNPTRFNDQAAAESFSKAVSNTNPGPQGITAGQYFTGDDGTQYKTVSGVNPNQPGWGNKVEPGYELIGYQAPQVSTSPRSGKGGGYDSQLGDNTGFAILQKTGTEPAAPVAPQQAAPAPTAPTVTPTANSQQYASEADQILAGIEAMIAGLPDYGAQIQQMQEDFAQSQRTLAANMAMSQKTPNLQIQPASGIPQTAGTQSFRRRQSQFNPGAAGTVLAGLNLGQPSMMNV